MIKKKIQWIGVVPDDELPGEDVASRGDAKRALRAVEDTILRLAQKLSELSPARLNRLELPEDVLDSVLDAQSIPEGPPRKRQLRVVRSALRATDWSMIQARHDALLKHGTIPASLQQQQPSAGSRAPEWVARLLGEGPAAIEELLLESPSLDRSHLRTLVRQVLKASADRRKKAEERLTAAVHSGLRK